MKRRHFIPAAIGGIVAMLWPRKAEAAVNEPDSEPPKLLVSNNGHGHGYKMGSLVYIETLGFYRVENDYTLRPVPAGPDGYGLPPEWGDRQEYPPNGGVKGDPSTGGSPIET